MVLDRIINRKIQDSKSTNRVIAATKAVTWRIVGTLDTWIISYLLTGQASLAFSIASIEVFTKMVLYYFHERGWEAVKRRIVSKQEDLE
jgi:uncharacterized membrane protein